MACLAPWAFGSVMARFEFYLSIGVMLLAVLGLAIHWKTRQSRANFCFPSLTLAALVVLAVVQAIPLPGAVLRGVAPYTADLRVRLLPRSGAAERVLGDSGPAVALPPPTIGQDSDATLHMAAQLASAWIVFQSVLSLEGGLASFRRFAIAITGNATLLALFALVQRLTWNGKIYWTYPAPFNDSGPFISHNHLAAYLNLGFGFALAVLLSPLRKGFFQINVGTRLWAGYAAGALVVGIVASHSRSGFLSMCAPLLIGLAVFRPRGIVLAIFLGSALLLIPVFLFMIGGSSSYEQRLATILSQAPYAGRMDIWRDALQAWRVSPLLGTGLGNFSSATARFFRNDIGEQYFHAENEYVEWLVEGGIVGFALVFATVVGIARLTIRAIRACRDDADRALLWGAALAGITLLVQSTADFAVRIPGVTVTAVVLCAYLSKSGLATGSALPAGGISKSAVRAGRVVPVGAFAASLVAVLSGVLLASAWWRARSEWEITQRTPFALAGGIPLTPDNKDYNWPEEFDWDSANAYRGALEEALRYRPNWAEGHLRHGAMLLALYRRWVLEGFDDNEEAKVGPAKRGELAHPSYLYKHVHAPEGLEPLSATELLNMEPVRDYLEPAARSFLEARRCSPLLALSHANLAVLDYLLEGGDRGPEYLKRALFLARADRRVLKFIIENAQLMHEPSIAAAGWKRLLILDGTEWEKVADEAATMLTPDQILDEVIPDGRTAIQFADRLFTFPWQQNSRRAYAEAALRQLPHDPDLSPAERLRWEAEAHALLGQYTEACDSMTRALNLEPVNFAWRRLLVAWLIDAGRFAEAHDAALQGIRYSNTPAAQQLFDHAREAAEKADRDAKPK